MADPEGTRKLEAILAADVAGYSRLMQQDDEATVATLEAYRAVFRQKIQAHRGRVVDMAGDSVLAVFEAATGAVRAAFEIQGVLTECNEALPEPRRMRFRIGVNLGEVIERPDGTVYGGGVNIAARLESIGEPGGVTVSGTVFDQVKNRLPVSFDLIGEQEVKNIAELVRAYRLVAEGASVSTSDRLKAKRVIGKSAVIGGAACAAVSAQLVSARIGRVTGHGIAFSLRKVLPALGPRGVRGMKFYIVGIFNRQGIGVGNGEAVPSLRTRCAVFPRREKAATRCRNAGTSPSPFPEVSCRSTQRELSRSESFPSIYEHHRYIAGSCRPEPESTTKSLRGSFNGKSSRCPLSRARWTV